jgi:hypothetical protein
VDEKSLRTSFGIAQAEAKAAFYNDALYLEKYIARPRHIEFQLFGDIARQPHPSRRARVLGAAQPPEADRGGAEPVPVGGAAPHGRRARGARRASIGYLAPAPWSSCSTPTAASTSWR